MQPIPGSTPPSGDSASPVDKPNLNKPRPLPVWARDSRWAQRYGRKSDGTVNAPPSPMPRKIAKAIANRRAYEKTIAANKAAIAEAAKRNTVPLAECTRVTELIRGKRKGRTFAFALGKRLAVAAPPRPELQAAVVGAKWNLRGVYLELLCWLIAGQLLYTWREKQRVRARGTYGTQHDLGELLGSDLAPALSERRVRDVMHSLRVWGLVHATPSFVAYGAVTSQRASIYRITTLAIDTFALDDILDRNEAPDPEPELAPRMPHKTRARAQAQARKTGSIMPPTPETNSLHLPSDRETKYFPDASAGRFIDGPTSPDTVSAARTLRLPAPVLDGTADESHREAPGETRNPSSRLYKPERREASPMISDVVPRVRRGDVDPRDRRDPNDGERTSYRPGAAPSDETVAKREDLDMRRRAAEQLALLEERKRKRAELERQARERAELAQAEAAKRARLENVPPPSDADAPVDVAGEGLAAARKAEIERMKRADEEFSHVQAPVRRRVDDDGEDLAEVIRRMTQSWEQNRSKRIARSAVRRGRGVDGGDS